MKKGNEKRRTAKIKITLKEFPIPAKAGISLSPRQRRKLQNEDREIPAFAGMERGEGENERERE